MPVAVADSSGGVELLRIALDAGDKLLASGTKWTRVEKLASLYVRAKGPYRVFLRFPPGDKVTIGQRREKKKQRATKGGTLAGGSGCYLAPGRGGELAVFTLGEGGAVLAAALCGRSRTGGHAIGGLAQRRGPADPGPGSAPGLL